MKKLLLILIIVFSATSCAKKVIDIKSPCVSSEDGPCGPKIPINEWWLKNSKKNYKTIS
jgi:hypothetical protein